MTEHGKIEHVLPNGDILIVDSTLVDDKVAETFDRVKDDLRDKAREAYRVLRDEPAAA